MDDIKRVRLQSAWQSAGDASPGLRDDRDLGQLVNQAPAILWSAAADGRVTWASQPWYEYTGLTAEENSLSWAQIVHPDDRERCAQAWAAALHGGTEYAVEVRNRRRDGVYRWFLTRATPARDRAGQITSWLGFTTDIHQFKLTEDVRRESQRRLRFALESAAIGEWEVDLVTGKIQTSPEHDRCFGAETPLANWSAEKFFSCVHPEDRGDVRRRLRAAQQAQTDCHFQFRVVWPDGSVHWLDAHSAIYLNPDGNPSHIAGIVRDITTSKTVEGSLREVYRQRDEFLANVSHDIRSPMASLMGFAELLFARLKDPTDREYVTVIKNSGNHLLELLDDLLDLAKMEAGRLEIAREPVAIRRLLSEAHALMKSAAEERTLRFSLNFDGPLPETVVADPARLRRVLLNLIGNAIKFTEHGQVELLARFDSARSQVELEVTDTGIGIAQEAQRRLFAPFGQFDSAFSSSESGSGLRLGITRRLIELMGGNITCQSTLDQGSCFRVTLPVGAPPTASLSGPPAPSVMCPRVLVADDLEGFRFLLQHHLEAAGVEVMVVADGQEVLNAFNQAALEGRPFSVVILDMRMPVLDGYETTRRLRAQGATVPIIALTAAAFEHEVENCYRAGCDAHLVKPIEPAKLLSAVTHWSGSRARSQQGAAPDSAGAPIEPKALQILLIDDDRVTCKSMAMLLEMGGHDVRVAYDGRSALAIAKDFHANVVVSDIKLPDMDGFALLRALRGLSGMEQAKFIALSGYGESEFSREAVKFHHYLYKPVKIEELETVLSSYKNQN